MAEKKKRRKKRVDKFETRMPEKIDDTPEKIMRALVETPPKKAEDWKYAKGKPAP